MKKTKQVVDVQKKKLHSIRMKNILFRPACILFAILSFLCSFRVYPANYSADIEKKQHLLILLSYHRGMDWEEGVLQGIREALATHGERVVLHIEYMDTQRFKNRLYTAKLDSLLRYKYRNKPLNAIITIDGPAFNYINSSPAIFPNIPVIFCGLDNVVHKKRAGSHPCTGVIESFNISETIQTALKLHPNTQKILLINNGLNPRQDSKENLVNLKKEYTNIAFMNMLKQSTSTLLSTTKRLPKNSVIILAAFARSRSKQFFGHHRVISQLIKSAAVPVYGIWDFYLGTGIVGGKLTSARQHGRSAGRLAEKILLGKKVTSIPVVKTPGRYMFDYEQLKKFDIDTARLPANALIINRPFDFYREHITEIIIILLFIVILAITIILLLLNIKKRKFSELQLRRSEKKLQLQVAKRTALLEEANIELSHSLDELEKDAEAGKQIQFQLLPDPSATFGEYSFNRLLLPSRFLSGDFLDYFEIDNRHIAFYTADVSGHGLPSSFITVFLKSLIDRYLERYRLKADFSILNPAMLLKNLNNEILRQKIDKHLTLFFAIIDRQNNRLTFSNGGQYPFPILSTNKETKYIEKNSPPVGMFDFSKYENITLPLADKFKLAIFSDGILEILPDNDSLEDKEEYLRRLVAKKKFDLPYLEKELNISFETNLPDDITLLLLSKEKK